MKIIGYGLFSVLLWFLTAFWFVYSVVLTVHGEFPFQHSLKLWLESDSSLQITFGCLMSILLILGTLSSWLGLGWLGLWLWEEAIRLMDA